MAVAVGIYKKESGTSKSPEETRRTLPGDFQDLDRVKDIARQEKAPDGYTLSQVYFLGKYSPI